MNNDIVIGILLLVGAMGLLTLLTAYSRRTINRIAANGFGTAREIKEKLKRG